MLFLRAACFFAAYNFIRNLLVIYLGGTVLFVLYNIANVLGARVADEHLAGLIDPFGLDTRTVVTKYWTIAERNTRLVPFQGDFLWNRLLWGELDWGCCCFRARCFGWARRPGASHCA